MVPKIKWYQKIYFKSVFPYECMPGIVTSYIPSLWDQTYKIVIKPCLDTTWVRCSIKVKRYVNIHFERNTHNHVDFLKSIAGKGTGNTPKMLTFYSKTVRENFCLNQCLGYLKTMWFIKRMVIDGFNCFHFDQVNGTFYFTTFLKSKELLQTFKKFHEDKITTFGVFDLSTSVNNVFQRVEIMSSQ